MHAHVYCTQVAVFILVALLANAFPHLNTTPPILFISHICGKERASDMAEERVPERHRGACMCARRHTEAGVMRVGASWWCNLFHPSSLCSPLPLAEAQRASSHCLLHCNLPSFAAKRRNQLTSFSTHHLLQNSSEDKLAFSGGVAERKVKKKKKRRESVGLEENKREIERDRLGHSCWADQRMMSIEDVSCRLSAATLPVRRLPSH